MSKTSSGEVGCGAVGGGGEPRDKHDSAAPENKESSPKTSEWSSPNPPPAHNI